MTVERVYMDYNSTSPLRPEAIAAMEEAMADAWGNASSLHWEGQRARAVLENARDRIAAAVGARHSEIVFTAGGTEANNLALFGAVAAAPGRYPHVVATGIEHDSVLRCCRDLESRGARCSYVSCDQNGRVDAGAAASAADEDTAVISVMHSNNETGMLQPAERIFELVSGRGIICHCDAVQSLGRVPLDVSSLRADLVTFSAHKLGGPKGIGALYVKEGTSLTPRLYGGHQEKALRPGTENVAAIAGFAAAVDAAVAVQPEESARLARLKTMLWQGMESTVGGAHLNGTLVDSLPNTINVSFDGIEARTALMALDLEGIAVASGSACAAAAGEPSHVLVAMCLADGRCRSALRFSLGFASTEDDVGAVLDRLPPVIARLRRAAAAAG